ncbi:MAG: ATP-binding cassette domain-containing protein [Ruminococcus sp.]|nr:ATP-binding cassette domain-containing protein [Ruminococcus sp.]MCM1381452.1 ATP-binding cassette domain-containing protein [Muribaculaceae bacterium]MCM1479678.1 ATP-binding cassette domain-containing protein [Muribaculaceae bacterium]
MNSILSIKNLSIQIKQRTLMQNISFDIGHGEAILLSGENGIGKSTILKCIMQLETDNKKISGEITHNAFGNIFKLDNEELQRFRASIAYIPQKDEYSEMGRIQVRDVISNSCEAHTGGDMSCSEVNELIDKWLPRRGDNSRIFDAKSNPGKFSGGEQRLLSVFSVIATRSNSDLLIIDEPLNNLDYVNARYISNLINKVIRGNPQMGLLMISHCRIFPFITREIKLSPEGVCEVLEHYVCHSCFGKPDENGFYN